MWRHYVYIHQKKDTEEVFYVGNGSFRKDRKPSYERANAKRSRNPFWNNIVKKHGYNVVIFASCKTDAVSQELEQELIKRFGRKDKGIGPLVNFTDGGDGHCGIIASDELREKRSMNSKGKRSETWVSAIRKSRKNGGNGGVVKKGDKLSQQWKDSIAATKNGKDNPMFGKRGKETAMAKKVFNIKTCKIYESVTEAAEVYGYNMKTLYNWLSGHRKNKTDLRFI